MNIIQAEYRNPGDNEILSDRELLVMKDSSEIIGAYPIEGITKLEEKKFQIGVVNVLNQGIRLSKGDRVAKLAVCDGELVSPGEKDPSSDVNVMENLEKPGLNKIT